MRAVDRSCESWNEFESGRISQEESMKRKAIIIEVMAISAWGFSHKGFAQSNNQPAAQNAPAGQAAGQAAAPPGKRKPQAKTQEDFAAYKAAAALTDPAAQEKAAAD